MIILITILAAILLFLLLVYPTIIRLYRIFHLGKEQMEKEKNADPSQPKISKTEASIVGKSTFTLSQPLPTTTTPIAKEPVIEENAPNFATENDPAPMDVDYPLDREENDDEINEEQEAIELEEMFGKDVSFASGITIDELHKLKQVVESTEASQTEQMEAGRILYENKETEIVEQLSSGKTASIISNLIDLHVTLHQKEQGGSKVVNESEELEDFDVNKFLNPK